MASVSITPSFVTLEHQCGCRYYFAGRDATEELFLSPSTFNYLAQRANVVKKVVAENGNGNKIWMGKYLLITTIKPVTLTKNQEKLLQPTMAGPPTCPTDLLELSCGWTSWAWEPP